MSDNYDQVVAAYQGVIDAAIPYRSPYNYDRTDDKFPKYTSECKFGIRSAMEEFLRVADELPVPKTKELKAQYDEIVHDHTFDFASQARSLPEELLTVVALRKIIGLPNKIPVAMPSLERWNTFCSKLIPFLTSDFED